MSWIERWLLVAVAVIATAALGSGLGRTDFWPPDEARVAEVAREMQANGRWLVPHLNDQPFLEEPPLFYWLQAAAFRVGGGPSTVAARVPAVAAATVGALLTAALARRLGASPLLAVVVLATAPEYWWMARSATPDTAAAAATAGALGLFWVAWCSGRRAALAAAVGALGIAFWCKSFLPVGLAVLTAGAFVACARRGRLRPRDLLLAVGGVGALSGVWIALMAAELGADAVGFFLVTNHVQRLLGAWQEGHVRGSLYYLPNLALDLFPWSLALPAAFVAAWRERATPGRLFPFLWAGVMTVALSISASKRPHYLLPAYPGFALLVAQWWAAAGRGGLDRIGRRLLVMAPLVVGPAVVLLTLGVTSQLAVMPLPSTPADVAAMLRDMRPGLSAWAAATGVAVLGLAAVRASRTPPGVRAAPALGACLIAVHLVLTLAVLPAVNPYCTARPWGERLGRLAAHGIPVVAYRFKDSEGLSPFMFYARRQFPELGDPDALVAALQDRPACVLLQERDYEALASRLAASPAARDRVGGLRLVLVETSPGLCTLQTSQS